MRWNGINDGTIKTFLILGLLAANVALTLPDDKAPAPAPGSALGEAPRAAREARALPDHLSP